MALCHLSSNKCLGILRHYQHLIPYAKKLMLQARKQPILGLRASGDLDNHGTTTLPQGLPFLTSGPRGSCTRDSAPTVHLWVAAPAGCFLGATFSDVIIRSCIIKVTHTLCALIGQGINYADIAAAKLSCLLYILFLPPKEMSDMMQQILKDVARVPQNIFKPLENVLLGHCYSNT